MPAGDKGTGVVSAWNNVNGLGYTFPQKIQTAQKEEKEKKN